MKRLLDLTFAMAVLIAFLPLGLFIAVVLRLTGEGKIFYLQPRVGRNGKTFKMIKFATMLEDSPNLGSGDITLKEDPRVLPVGKILRKTKLNEVPQVINILKGEMSVVGPRPLTRKNFDLYPEDVKRDIVKVPPGLTGIGSITHRDEESIIARSSKTYLDCYREEIAPYKGMLEQWYIANRSFTTDLKIILLTAWVLVFPESVAYRRIFPDLPEREESHECVSEGLAAP